MYLKTLSSIKRYILNIVFKLFPFSFMSNFRNSIKNTLAKIKKIIEGFSLKSVDG